MSAYVLKGLTPWLLQRISAVIIALFLFYVFACAFTATDISYQAWLTWLFTPFHIILIGLFTIALLLHAWIGMRDIVLDYIHPLLLRIFFLTGIAGTLVACGLWIARILLLTTAQ